MLGITILMYLMIGTQQGQKQMTCGETTKKKEAEAILKLFRVSPQTMYFSSTGRISTGQVQQFWFVRQENQVILGWVTQSEDGSPVMYSLTIPTDGTSCINLPPWLE